MGEKYVGPSSLVGRGLYSRSRYPDVDRRADSERRHVYTDANGLEKYMLSSFRCKVPVTLGKCG
jgi:hypothetical protein